MQAYVIGSKVSVDGVPGYTVEKIMGLTSKLTTPTGELKIFPNTMISTDNTEDVPVPTAPKASSVRAKAPAASNTPARAPAPSNTPVAVPTARPKAPVVARATIPISTRAPAPARTAVPTARAVAPVVTKTAPVRATVPPPIEEVKYEDVPEEDIETHRTAAMLSNTTTVPIKDKPARRGAVQDDIAQYLEGCTDATSLITAVSLHPLFGNINPNAYNNLLVVENLLSYGLAKMRCLNLLRSAARKVGKK